MGRLLWPGSFLPRTIDPAGGDGWPGHVLLVDLFDNQPGSAGTEALYLQNLFVGPGPELDLNGIHVYVGGALVSPGDGALYGGGVISAVPEPATLALVAVGAMLISRRRRR